MKHSKSLIRRISSQECFVKLFSRLVSYLIQVEKQLICDTNDMTKSMEEYAWIFEQKPVNIITDKEYSGFFSTLAVYYEKNKKHRKAKTCHEKILQRSKDCHKECGTVPWK